MITWTPDALASEARRLGGKCWRLVEAQHLVSTLKLVDTLAEQAVLEDLIEAIKPSIPPECRHLHYLLASPFRYGSAYPTGSRFRRAGITLGVFYASEAVETAVAEMAFYRVLFFADSPATPWPANAVELTAFSVSFETERGLDLTAAPFSADQTLWTHPTGYEACQNLCDSARAAELEAIRYQAVRDPAQRANLALLTCKAFKATRPEGRQSWRMRVSASGVQALREFPNARIEFAPDAFASDPRIANLDWRR